MSQFDWKTLALIPVASGLVFGVSKLVRVGSREAHLPPGPPTLPILGNLTALPLKDTYLKFTEWARQYGGVYSLKVGSHTMIVASSLDAIYEIFEKNSAITTDKRKYEPLRRIAGEGGMIVMAPDGALWRRWRRAGAEIVTSTARQNHLPIQMAETSQLVFDTMKDPGSLYHHIRRFTASVIFSVICGTRTPRTGSAMLTNFFHVAGTAMQIAEPGDVPPIDLLPILNLLPDKFANNWRSRCDTIRGALQEISSELIIDAKERIKTGQDNGCHLETLLKRASEWELDEEDIGWITLSLLIAASGPTASHLQFVILMAACFPEAQRKVHEELDRVVGRDQSPTIEDIPRLPYLTAFMRETHRFRPVIALVAPRSAQADQVYQGYVLPKDSILFTNLWALFHDPDLFENPDTFEPDRYIRSPSGTKPGVEERTTAEALNKLDTMAFGAGKRKCLGLAMAETTILLAIANLFWSFTISPGLNEDGTEIKPDPWDFTARLEHTPTPFNFQIKLRSERHEEIIAQNYVRSIDILQQFEMDLKDDDKAYLKNVREGL